MKTVHLVRHGESEHNFVCGGTPEVDEDPLVRKWSYLGLLRICEMILSSSTVRYLQQAENKSSDLLPEYPELLISPLRSSTGQVKDSGLKPDLIICSPLCRALETALAFAHLHDVPIVIHPWARERVDTACDLGTPASLLKAKWAPIFPSANFSLLTEEIWFYAPLSTTVENYQELFKKQPWKESFEDVQLRIGQLKEWIKNHEAKEIVVVGHSAYFKEWLNAPTKMPNCHIHTCTL